jgi:hypothetical protein
MTATAVALAVAAVVLAGGYLLTGGDRGLLIGSSSASLATAAVTGLFAWRYRASGRRLRLATAEVVAAIREEHATLRQEIGRVGVLLEQLSARTGLVGQVAVDRLDRMEQRVDDLQEKVDQTATAEAIVARATGHRGGQVHQLRPR